MTDKAALKDELVAALRAERDTLRAAQLSTQKGATHEENRAEGDKDMRSTEASYLARGQAERVVALERDLALVERMELRELGADDAIVLSAVVELSAERGSSVVFLAPAGGGTRLQDGHVRVITPTSPLGKALLGVHTGDEVEVDQGERVLAYEVLQIS